MRNLRNSLIAALWCGLVATPAAMLVFHNDVLLAVGCAAGCGALLGGPILQPARIPSAGEAALRGLVITFCAYWLCLGLPSIRTASFEFIGIGLLGIIYVGWILFPMGAAGAALLWLINERLTRTIKAHKLRRMAAEAVATNHPG